MDSIQDILDKQEGVDEDTREYLLAALPDVESSEWREILEPFLPPEAVEAIVALAPEDSLSVPSMDFKPAKRDVPICLNRTTSAMSAIPEDGEKSAKAKLSVGRFYNTHPDGDAQRAEDDSSSNASAAEDATVAKGRRARAKQRDRNPQNLSREASVSSTASVGSEVSNLSNLRDKREKPTVTVRQRRAGDTVTNTLSIDIKDLTVTFGGRNLLDDAHLRLLPGRYGFVGANGAGKSTLLRLMNEKCIPGYPDLETLLVEQEDIGDEKTPVQAVVSANELLARLKWEESILEQGLATRRSAAAHLRIEIRRLENQMSALDVDRQRLVGERGKQASSSLRNVEKQIEQLRADLLSKEELTDAEDTDAPSKCTALLQEVKSALAELDEESLQAKATKILRGLGLKKDQLEAPTSSLSGGWRMRVALAKALTLEPKVMILDEPTNHLDWGSMIWLEEYLQKLSDIILVVVSHDRQFLDNFSTSILRLARGKLDVFKGNYTEYEQTAAQLHRAEEKEEEKKTSVGQVRRKRTKAKLEFEKDVYLQIEVGPKLSYTGPLMQCRGVVAGYPDKRLTKAIDFDLNMSSRVAIIGHNGCGKTTLLRTIAHDLQPIAGEVYTHHSLNVGYFAQHQADALPSDKTPLQVLTAFGEDLRELEAEDILASFGFSSRQARQQIGSMSGGEKSRLALARIVIKRPHMLLLDEPTNHLDLLTVEALSDALNAFQGGILLVSHDRRLIREVCPEAHQQYLLDDGQLKRADGLSKFERSVRVAIKKDAHG